MALVNKNLYGCWKLTAMRYQISDGSWEDEVVFGGNAVFTESGEITTFTRTADLAFGYSGKFVLRGDDLVITPQVSSITAIEGKTIIRTVKILSAGELTLGMHDDATGRNYEIGFKLLTRQFAL